MKKFVVILSIASIIGMVSCSKENNVTEVKEPSSEKIVFSASIDMSSETKASLADMVGGKAIHWSASDKIAVANDQNDADLTEMRQQIEANSQALTVQGMRPIRIICPALLWRWLENLRTKLLLA